MTEVANKAQILPFYLTIDVSWSMSEEGKIDSANGIVKEMRNALIERPIVADKVRFSVIDFSEDARVVVPLCDLSMYAGDAAFEVRGGTSYVAAFEKLHEQIQADVDQLKADGFAVHRPSVFFVSDGHPTDEEGDWRASFAALTGYDASTKTGFAYFPNVIPFGIGAAPEVMNDLIHPRDKSKCFLMKEGANAGKVLAEMADIMVQSTVMSGASAGAGGPGFVLPDEKSIAEDVQVGDYGVFL